METGSAKPLDCRFRNADCGFRSCNPSIVLRSRFCGIGNPQSAFRNPQPAVRSAAFRNLRCTRYTERKEKRVCGMKSEKISELTTDRLSVYLRCLNTLTAAGIKTVSSQALADQFNLNSAQIRKDLAYFGEFGVRGVGYF